MFCRSYKSFILYRGFWQDIVYSEENDPINPPSKLKNDCCSKKINKEGSNHLCIDKLINIRHTYPSNPIIGYLNINSRRNKVASLGEIIDKTLRYFLYRWKKHDECFPELQFLLIPTFRRSLNSRGGVKMVFVKQGSILKKIKAEINKKV